jgi:signal recognition particle receptor subunit beta
MKRGIIVTGSQGSGKTVKIKELVNQIPLNQIVWIHPDLGKIQLSSFIKKDTTTVVIDQIVNLEQMKEIHNYIKEGNKLSNIFPQIIVSVNSIFFPDLSNFENDFEIIKLKGKF